MSGEDSQTTHTHAPNRRRSSPHRRAAAPPRAPPLLPAPRRRATAPPRAPPLRPHRRAAAGPLLHAGPVLHSGAVLHAGHHQPGRAPPAPSSTPAAAQGSPVAGRRVLLRPPVPPPSPRGAARRRAERRRPPPPRLDAQAVRRRPPPPRLDAQAAPRPRPLHRCAAELEEERRKREELEARLEAERQRSEENERLRAQQMLDWHNWMTTMARNMGQTPPPMQMQFTPPIMTPPPAAYSPNFAGSAAASNDAPPNEDLPTQIARGLFGPSPPPPVWAQTLGKHVPSWDFWQVFAECQGLGHSAKVAMPHTRQIGAVSRPSPCTPRQRDGSKPGRAVPGQRHSANSLFAE
nr:unnamed protein product [Digitaria exilis]